MCTHLLRGRQRAVKPRDSPPRRVSSACMVNPVSSEDRVESECSTCDREDAIQANWAVPSRRVQFCVHNSQHLARRHQRDFDFSPCQNILNQRNP